VAQGVEILAPDDVGHSRKQTMGTTAIYSQGDRVNLRKMINKLRYSPRVMRLIEAAGQSNSGGAKR
jgi:hypothetical protein